MKNLIDFNQPSPSCIGLIYRGKFNAYIDKTGQYIQEERLYPLKRKSCKGCNECVGTLDAFKESFSNDELPIINNLKDGQLYKLCIVNASKSMWYDDPYVEYDLEFKEYDEKS